MQHCLTWGKQNENNSALQLGKIQQIQLQRKETE